MRQTCSYVYETGEVKETTMSVVQVKTNKYYIFYSKKYNTISYTVTIIECHSSVLVVCNQHDDKLMVHIHCVLRNVLKNTQKQYFSEIEQIEIKQNINSILYAFSLQTLMFFSNTQTYVGYKCVLA